MIIIQSGLSYICFSTHLLFAVPLVSRMLPSDTCRILKRGTRVRMDTTLIDFNDMRWQRGNNTFLFNGDAKPDNSLVVLNNDNKLYQRVRYEVRYYHVCVNLSK